VTAGAGWWRRGDHEVSLARLYAIRALTLLAIYGLLPVIQELIVQTPGDRGVQKALIAALWVMAFFVLRYPLKFIPVLLLEMAWKTIWLLAYGLPQWLSGTGPPSLAKDLWSIGAFGAVVMPLVIPWGYVWRHYFKQPVERWRSA
jgi:hypothetical protein